jgi:uncharacterized protein YdaU (DUF1376 family)
MHYYQFNPAAYCLDTAHLTNKEDLAYRRLLDLSYTSEKELPLDITLLARKVRCGVAEVKVVIAEFFTETEKGYVNDRVQLELSKLKEFVEAGKAGAEKRWGKKKKSPPTESDMAPDSPPIEGHEQNDGPLMLPNTYNLLPSSPIVPTGDVQTDLLDKNLHLNRARMLFRMHPSTQLDSSQLRSWKKNKGVVETTSERGWLLLEWLHSQGTGKGEAGEFRRRDLSTLFNHWNGEIQLAEREANNRGVNLFKKEKRAGDPEPEGWRRILVELYDDSDPEAVESATWDGLPPAVRAQIKERMREVTV